MNEQSLEALEQEGNKVLGNSFRPHPLLDYRWIDHQA